MYFNESLHSKGWNMVHVMPWALEMPSPAKHIKDGARTKEEILVFGSQWFADVMQRITRLSVWVFETNFAPVLVFLASLGFLGPIFF